MSYIGWEIPAAERARLLGMFVPKYPDVIAHHITQRLGGKKDPTLPTETIGWVVGHADDGMGLEALVVMIGGTTDRPDGKTFHITWSLNRDAGMAPKMSSGIIADYGWQDVEPILIDIQPKHFES